MHGTCAVVDGVLTGYKEMFSRRAPGSACLSALKSGKMGTMDQPINDSKGCGGVMRVAPIGLACSDAEKAFRMGCESAAITHGHPTGYLSAGFLAALISRLVAGDPLEAALCEASRILETRENHDECRKAVAGAVALYRHREPSPEALETLGAGWVAEEALAIGLYAALAAGDDFRQGALLAVNHSGDSDSTGSVAGAIMGARYGASGIPGEWLDALEMKDVIEETAIDLFNQFIRITDQ
jgi:ADP-ribosylglycohydrolase